MTAIPPCRWCPTPGRVLLALGWAVFLGLTFGPVAGLFAEAAARLAAGEPEASAALVPSARQRALLGRSLALAGGVAVFAGLVGSLAALALLRRLAHGRGSRLLRAGLLAALVLWVVTPPYLHALAGMEAGNWMRAALSGLGAPSRLIPDLPGPVSALLAQGFALMPIAMVAAAIGFLSVERDLIDAAMLLGPGHRVFLRIVLPLAAPAIFAGSGAVFVFSLIDYSTPSLFGLSSYAMEIVAEYSASRAPWRAALIALPLIAITGLVIHAQMRRVDPLLIDAARLQRPPGPARWLRIELPLAAPGLAAAAGLVFCASIGELDATMMTAAPGQGVLSMLVFNYLHYGVSETVAALGLLLAAIVWTAAALGLWLAGRQG
jgi:ABC-type Fe3+ transport system permease subunit